MVSGGKVWSCRSERSSGGVEVRQRDGKAFSSLNSSKKIEEGKNSGGHLERFFFSALITGLLSDRSLSKSYKLEGGGWNRDWATLSQSLSLFHFSLHKHATGRNTQKAIHMHYDLKHFSHAKNRNNVTYVTKHKHGRYCFTFKGLMLVQQLAQLTKATLELRLSSSPIFTHTTSCSNNQH